MLFFNKIKTNKTNMEIIIELFYNQHKKYILLNIFCVIYFTFFTKIKDKGIFSFLFNTKDSLNQNSIVSNLSKYLCDLLVVKNGNCTNEILSNYNFFYSIDYIKKNVTISIDVKKSFIENFFLIIGIVPFLKFNSTIKYSIFNKGSYKLYRLIFNYKKKKKGIILINIGDLQTIIKKLNDSINYIWGIPLQKKMFDIIRYIIDNYYDDTCLNIYEDSLNNNYHYYIKKKTNKLPNFVSKELASKYLYNIFKQKMLEFLKKKDAAEKDLFQW